jgi:RNA polymerase sigma-70 factor (ECF subfamily)
MAAIASMPLPARERIFRPAEMAPGAPTALPDADSEARRLASAVARGDETAFDELYDRYRERLFRLAVVLSRGDETAAHEIVQSTMLTAAAKLKPVQSEDHLWNWLARVARQKLAKLWRQQNRQTMIESVSDLPEIADARTADRELEARLDAALQALDGEERQIVEWFYFEGHSHKDIAERLDTTPKAVSSRLERTRVKLRTLLTGKLSYET